MAEPHPSEQRIEALDVLRGVALLGILLMNILGFGLHSAGYFNPLVGSNPEHWSHGLNLGLWALLDVSVEGAMRALFCALFGAGLVLFTTGENAKPAHLHYRRQFWLLMFGLLNAYVLLWSGDVLVTYALCGMLLYPLRNARPRALLWIAGGLLVVLALLSGLMQFALDEARQAAQVVAATAPGAPLRESLELAAQEWRDFADGMSPHGDQVQQELAVRRGSYGDNFLWNAEQMLATFKVALPSFVLWDALLAMLIGMALQQWGILSAARPKRFYQRLLVIGLVLGVLINGAETAQRVHSGFAPMALFGFFEPSYHLGRLSMALAWLGAVLLFCQSVSQRRLYRGLRQRLAAVGRMALTNYVMHSVLALMLFSGVGLGWVGLLERWQLYLVVLAIWALQLVLSPWWLQHFRFGPLEWLWRWLTYGVRPAL